MAVKGIAAVGREVRSVFWKKMSDGIALAEQTSQILIHLFGLDLCSDNWN